MRSPLSKLDLVDRLALLLSLLGVIIGWLVAERVYERMAHIEDELAYVWQAQAIAAGHLKLPSPPGGRSFLVPFVVDYQGWRFSKYPLGWPVVLALGVRLGQRDLVNPLLSGLGVWLIYRLGRRLFGPLAGLLAAGLTLISPFFQLNSGALLSHPLGLVLSTAFTLAWLAAWEASDDGVPRSLPLITAFAALGGLALTRPLTAVAISLPFAFHGLYHLLRGGKTTRLRLLAGGGLLLGIVALHFAWQYAVTGDPFLNPYTLWWSYDSVGFGPGHGLIEGGHTLRQAWINTEYSLWVGAHDLFGWGRFSWIFLPFGLLAAFFSRLGRRRVKINGPALLVYAQIPSLVIVYLAYWIGSWLYGPRYYYESLPALTICSAAGIAWMAGWPLLGAAETVGTGRWLKVRRLGMTAVIALLAAVSLFGYSPVRLGGMFGLYHIQRADLEPFLTPQAQELTPALIVVHVVRDWTDYGALLELQTPFLDTPFIFIISRGEEKDQVAIQAFPERRVFHYYPDEPFTFYRQPRTR